MHEFRSKVNKVNKAVAKVRTIGDRLPLIHQVLMRQFFTVVKSYEEFRIATHSRSKVCPKKLTQIGTRMNCTCTDLKAVNLVSYVKLQ